MTENDKQRFFEVWTAAWQTVGKTPGTEGMRLAFNVLARFELRDVMDAIAKHLADPERGRYAITPADIVSRLEEKPEDTASRVWPKVIAAVKRYGRYRNVSFDDPAVNEAIRDIGGWLALCNSTERDLPRLQANFSSAYAHHKRAGTDSAGMLAGEHGDAPVHIVRLTDAKACVKAS